ncbi:uncharacterized protein LOC128629108 isoform X1 [Ictalurus punctatus]|uniref:Uncharacterized protein LOC128629108 isoform X1 n=1 Tax=Ictalurus punctatus TaxID=7998 RepID=A0A9F7QRK0_ICTPU|nr:uncharacterized protein LOC128629108 isoform X1 [Ictalurus punctatus]XP_053531454.1 uncharacterized protein LOC128629108 isoform X1 [Ictalurus punctatus]XP_053531455.1 uncharacterized protein LOC128629108 isoform X1 [Ictalurus punctatus]XP_053531457.1 uncharacterized protein LOC128629108 isoform X1 [Ictalurus punctatus]
MPPPHNRVRLLIRDMMTVTQYQAILAVARNDFLKIFRKLVSSAQVLSTEETSYRRYCTALLVLRHFQCPAAVQGLTVSEWVNRKEVDDRVVIGFGRNETMQRAACFALTKEEEAWLQAYYSHIRPRVIRSDLNCDRFFLSSADTALLTVSNDLGVLHKAYEKSWSMGTLENFLRATSRQARGALETAAANLMDTEKEAVSSYLAYNTAVAKLRRVPTPQTVVATATLLDSLAGSDTDRFSGPSGTKSLDFAAFLMRFPASADSKAPTKLDRLKAGFPGDRVFYDKWRAAQKAKRMERLLKAFTRKPQESRVKYGILKEGWKNNCPKPADVLAAWKPATQFVIETDEDLRRNVSQQTWKGLAIKDFGGEKGLAVVATQPFSKGDIVCDYHGKVITYAQGKVMMQNLQDEAVYLFFFRTGQRPLCIDAQTFPCECHPCADTVGRRLNHSSKQANLCPEPFVLKVNGQDVDVVLFRALRDISVDIELKFDYGVKRKSFRGEDQDLQWLDE